MLRGKIGRNRRRCGGKELLPTEISAQRRELPTRRARIDISMPIGGYQRWPFSRMLHEQAPAFSEEGQFEIVRTEKSD